MNDVICDCCFEPLDDRYLDSMKENLLKEMLCGDKRTILLAVRCHCGETNHLNGSMTVELSSVKVSRP